MGSREGLGQQRVLLLHQVLLLHLDGRSSGIDGHDGIAWLADSGHCFLSLLPGSLLLFRLLQLCIDGLSCLLFSLFDGSIEFCFELVQLLLLCLKLVC